MLIVDLLHKKNYVMRLDTADQNPFTLFPVVGANGHSEDTHREPPPVLTTPGSLQTAASRTMGPQFTYPLRSSTRFLTTSAPTNPVSEVALWSLNLGRIAAEDTSSVVWILAAPSILWPGLGASPQRPTARTSTPESLGSPTATLREGVTYYPSTPPPSFNTVASSTMSRTLP